MSDMTYTHGKDGAYFEVQNRKTLASFRTKALPVYGQTLKIM